MILKRHSVLPGFDLALGFTTLYLSLIVLLPLTGLLLKAASLSPEEFWALVTTPRALSPFCCSC